MLLQQSYIVRFRDLVQADARFVAALMYGSFARGDGDRHSDVEFYLFLPAAVLASFDRESWVGQVAPVELAFFNEFGTFVVFFDSLIRAEFHFEPEGRIPDVAGWIFERLDPDQMLMKDRNGVLRRALEQAASTPCWESDSEAAREQSERLLNWLLLATNVYERGEYARTLDALSYAHRFLLRAARLRGEVAGCHEKRAHWLNPTRSLEGRADSRLLERFASCTASLDEDGLRSALCHSWRWGAELARGLETESVWRRVLSGHPGVAALVASS